MGALCLGDWLGENALGFQSAARLLEGPGLDARFC